MTKFNIKKALNPVESIFTAYDKDNENPITFRLRPVDTSFAFDGSRWQNLIRAGKIDDAVELQFQMGLNRIQGWNGVQDEDGNDVAFTIENFSAFTRLLACVPYVMAVGQETLKEVDALPAANFQDSGPLEAILPKAEIICEARVIPAGTPGETTPEPEAPGEASETNSEQPST